MTDYAIIRVSSDEQAVSGLSIQTQIQNLLEPCSKYPDKNLLAENIFKAEGCSGGFKEDNMVCSWDEEEINVKFKLKNRPDFKELRKHCKRNDRIFITKFDRLARDFAFLEIFIKICKGMGIEICPLDDNSDVIVRQILSVLGQWERDKTIKRVDDVIKGMFDNGIHPYKAPFGYDKNTKNDKGKLKFPKEIIGCLLIKPEEAEIIKDVFEMTASGCKYKEIIQKHELDVKGYYNIIHNRFYCGYIKYKDQEKKGIHVPIVSEEIWNKANENIKQKDRL